MLFRSLACPHHGYETHRLIEIFIENLTPETSQFIEMMCNGQFDQKTDEAWEFLGLMAENAQKWASSEEVDHSRELNQPKGGGIYHVNNQIDIQAKLAALTREVESLKLGRNKETTMFCGMCASETHGSADCPTVPALHEALQEQANVLNTYQKPFNANNMGNTYNPSWRNHPNFSWRNGPSANSEFNPQRQSNVGAHVPQQPNTSYALQSKNKFLEETLN